MEVFVALLRAVNVGGTGKLPMATLKKMCETEGYSDVRTYIASGNVVFRANASARHVQDILQKRLAEYAGKPVGVLVRTATEIDAVVAANPFPQAKPSRTVAIFLNDAPEPSALSALRGRSDEVLRLGKREIYVYYPDSIAQSKLVIPSAASGTARNMNTVAKLAEIAKEISG